MEQRSVMIGVVLAAALLAGTQAQSTNLRCFLGQIDSRSAWEVPALLENARMYGACYWERITRNDTATNTVVWSSRFWGVLPGQPGAACPGGGAPTLGSVQDTTGTLTTNTTTRCCNTTSCNRVVGTSDSLYNTTTPRGTGRIIEWIIDAAVQFTGRTLANWTTDDDTDFRAGMAFALNTTARRVDISGRRNATIVRSGVNTPGMRVEFTVRGENQTRATGFNTGLPRVIANGVLEKEVQEEGLLIYMDTATASTSTRVTQLLMNPLPPTAPPPPPSGKDDDLALGLGLGLGLGIPFAIVCAFYLKSVYQEWKQMREYRKPKNQFLQQA